MRWALAGAGLVLEAAALAVCLLPSLQRRVKPFWSLRGAMLAWALGAAALSIFAILDHDVTLLAGQVLACTLFVCLAQKR